MQPASAAEVFYVDDSDTESADFAVAVGEQDAGGPVFQQPSKVKGKAGVKQKPGAEEGIALAAATAAVGICSEHAAFLGDGMPASMGAQARLAAAGEQIATNQPLPGALGSEFNPKEAVGEGGRAITDPRAPGEVAIGAGAGPSSGNVAGTAGTAAAAQQPFLVQLLLLELPLLG